VGYCFVIIMIFFCYWFINRKMCKNVWAGGIFKGSVVGLNSSMIVGCFELASIQKIDINLTD